MAFESPHLLIGGDKNTVSPMEKAKTCHLKIGIDWLTFTIPRFAPDDLVKIVFEMCSTLVKPGQADLVLGRNTLKGCQQTFDFSILDEDSGELVPIAKIGQMKAGETSRAMYVFSISGEGCPYFDMAKVAKLAPSLGGKITRVDTAMDDFEGAYTVKRAQSMYRAGKFQAVGSAHGGKMPLSNFIEKKNGDQSLGKTFYVGDRKNGKMLRVYEKGMKEQDVERPNWVRWEVQFGNKDRVVPWDILTNPATYFLGAYAPFPALFGKHLHNATPSHIKTEQNKKAAKSLSKSIKHVRIQFGKLVNVGRSKLRAMNLPDSILLDLITRDGIPAKLVMPDVVALERLFGPARLCPFGESSIV